MKTIILPHHSVTKDIVCTLTVNQNTFRSVQQKENLQTMLFIQMVYLYVNHLLCFLHQKDHDQNHEI